MKIIKYDQFINENIQETPEEYIKVSLTKLKKRIEKFFDESEESDDNVSNVSVDVAKEKGKEKDSKKGNLSFKELGVKLEISEFSKYSAIYDSVTIKFSDENCLYSLYITIPLEEGISKDKEADFSDKDIKKCYVKFKKYDTDEFELIGQIAKTVEIAEIDENFLIELKIELDEEFSEDDEKLEFETE